jgi:hypothetical protein
MTVLGSFSFPNVLNGAGLIKSFSKTTKQTNDHRRKSLSV